MKNDFLLSDSEIEEVKKKQQALSEVIPETAELGFTKGMVMGKELLKAGNPILFSDSVLGELDTTDQKEAIKEHRKNIAEVWKASGTEPTLLEGIGLGAVESITNPVEVGAGLLSGGIMSKMGLGVLQTFIGEQAIDMAYDTIQTIKTEDRIPTTKEIAINALVNAGFEGAGSLIRLKNAPFMSENVSKVAKNASKTGNVELNIKADIENLHDNIVGVKGYYSAKQRIEGGDYTTYLQKYNETKVAYDKNVELLDIKRAEIEAVDKQLGLDVKVDNPKDLEVLKGVMEKKRTQLTQEVQNLENINKDLFDIQAPHVRKVADELKPFMDMHNQALRDRTDAVAKLALEKNIPLGEASKLYGKEVTFNNAKVEQAFLTVDANYHQDIRQNQKQYNILLGEEVNRYMRSDEFVGGGYDYGDLIYSGDYDFYENQNVARLLKQSDIDNAIIYNRSRGGDGGKLATVSDKGKVLADFNKFYNSTDPELVMDFNSYANNVVPEGWTGKVAEGKKVTVLPRKEYESKIINEAEWPAFKEKLADITKSNPTGAHYVEGMYSKKRREAIQMYKNKVAKESLVEHGAEVTPENIKLLADQMDDAKLEKNGAIITDEINAKIHDEIYRDIAVDMHSMLNDISNSRISERGKTNIETMGLDQIAKRYPMFGGDKFFLHTPYKKNNMEIMADIYNVTAKKSSMIRNYGSGDRTVIRDNFRTEFKNLLEGPEYANRSLNIAEESEVFLEEVNEVFDNLMESTLFKGSRTKKIGEKAFDTALNVVRWKVMAGSGLTEYITNMSMIDFRMSKYANINSTLALMRTGKGIANADSKYLARASLKVVDAKSTGKFSSNKSLKEKVKNALSEVNDLGYIFQEKSDDMAQLLSHASITELSAKLPVDFKKNSNEVIDVLRTAGITEENYLGFKNFAKEFIEGNGDYLDIGVLTDLELFSDIPEQQALARSFKQFYNSIFFDVGSPINKSKVFGRTKGNLNKMQMTFRGWSRSMGDQGLQRIMYAKNAEGMLVGRASAEGVGLTATETIKKVKNNFGQSAMTAGIMLASGLASKQAWNFLYGDVTFPEAIAVMKAHNEKIEEAYNDKDMNELFKQIVVPAVLEGTGLSVLTDGGFSFKGELKAIDRAFSPFFVEQNIVDGTNIQEGLKASGQYATELIIGTKVRRFGDKVRLGLGFGDEALSSTNLKDPVELQYLADQFAKEDVYSQAEMDKTYRTENVLHDGPIETNEAVVDLFNRIDRKVNFPVDQKDQKLKELQFLIDQSVDDDELLYFLGQRYGITEADL